MSTNHSDAAVTPPLPPTIREELRIALEHLHVDHRNGHVPDQLVLDLLRGWRPDMPDEGLWHLWETTSAACGRLATLRAANEGPLLQFSADAVVEACITELAGAAR